MATYTFERNAESGVVTHTTTIEAVDIPTMGVMSNDAYLSYVQTDLFFVDHHGILRSSKGDYPIATSRKQLDLLVAHLNDLREQVAEDDYRLR